LATLLTGGGLTGQVSQEREENQQQQREYRDLHHPGPDAPAAALHEVVPGGLTFRPGSRGAASGFGPVKAEAAATAAEGPPAAQGLKHVAPGLMPGVTNVSAGAFRTVHGLAGKIISVFSLKKPIRKIILPEKISQGKA